MRSLLVLAVAFAALSVAGCNTLAGMGQDTTAAGHAVTNTANDAK
jgi:entericidin B